IGGDNLPMTWGINRLVKYVVDGRVSRTPSICAQAEFVYLDEVDAVRLAAIGALPFGFRIKREEVGVDCRRGAAMGDEVEARIHGEWDIDVVDIPFPMDPGLYLFAHGGSTATVNAHFLTLNPKTERQRAYRGQTYSVDFVKIDKFGLRADGWRPADPSVYNIFNQPVYSPCHGEVITADDKMPDMQVPQLDRSRLEGNHVLINCGDFAILLAHLKNGTVEVAMGDRVVTGQRLGLAGNSGQTGEPHMHIHAQRLPAEGPPLSGEPIFLTLNGKFPVRNSVVRVRKQDTAAEALATKPNSEQ
ncbi:MAG: M23 family metallopeptidase, partial [Pseudomonadota bacterium]